MVALFSINMFIKEFCKLSMKEVVSLFSGCLAIFILSKVDYESKFCEICCMSLRIIAQEQGLQIKTLFELLSFCSGIFYKSNICFLREL